jgi:rubrerythrin
MAHLKYLYFAKRAREAGAVDIAEIFERTAAVEATRAFAHLDLLLPKASTPLTDSLEMAIADETEEYAEIYPKFRHLASQAGDIAAVRDFEAQIEESKQHASDFKKILESNARRVAPSVGHVASQICLPVSGLSKPASRPYLAQWEVQA